MYDSWQLGNVLVLGCGHPTPAKTCNAHQLEAFQAYVLESPVPHFPLFFADGRAANVSEKHLICRKKDMTTPASAFPHRWMQ
jgi:hypothetical protein